MAPRTVWVLGVVWVGRLGWIWGQILVSWGGAAGCHHSIGARASGILAFVTVRCLASSGESMVV